MVEVTRICNRLKDTPIALIIVGGSEGLIVSFITTIII